MLPQLPLPVPPLPVWSPNSSSGPVKRPLSLHDHSFPPSPIFPSLPSHLVKSPALSLANRSNPSLASPSLDIGFSHPSHSLFMRPFPGQALRPDPPTPQLNSFDNDPRTSRLNSFDNDRRTPQLPASQNVTPSHPQIYHIQQPSQDEILLESAQSEHAHQEIFGTPVTGLVGKTRPRAVVRIARDYSARGATTGRVQFWDGWVSELDGRVTPLELQNTLNDLNGILASAYDPYRSILDNTLSVLTFYLSPLFLTTHYKKQMKLFSEALQEANRTTFNPAGLNILHPRKVAFLFLEIEYY